MKKLIIALVATALFTPVANANIKTRCENMAIIAKNAMSIRQRGDDLSLIYNDLKPTSQKILLMAYNKPIYSTEKYKQRAIGKFTNMIFVGCLSIK